MQLAQAGQHGFQAGRLGHRDAADVEEVHDARDALQPRRRASRPKLAASTSKLTRAPTCVKRAPS